MFKVAYYDEDKKDICSKEINSIEELKEILSKVYPNILPDKRDHTIMKKGKLTILIANLIVIPYLGPEEGFVPSKCRGRIIPDMKLSIYMDDYLPVSKEDFKNILCKLYYIENDEIINRLYRIYEVEIIDGLDTDIEGILVEKAFKYRFLLNIEEVRLCFHQ